jgi:hypothetical protein
MAHLAVWMGCFLTTKRNCFNDFNLGLLASPIDPPIDRFCNFRGHWLKLLSACYLASFSIWEARSI